MSNLFLDPEIQLQKVASAAKLEEDPDRWSIEIIKVGMKNLPSLKNYELDVELDRVDPARGYAVGKILVYPAGMKKEAAAEFDKLVSLPVIVRERELSPFDVYSHKSCMYPMDERDLQEIMIHHDLFAEAAPKGQFQGTDLYSQLAPPTTDHQYGAGSLAKVASASLLTGAVTHAPTSKWESFKSQINTDPGLKLAFTTNPVLAPYLEVEKEKVAHSLDEAIGNIRPSVVQFTYESGRFLVKTANHEYWDPQAQEIDRWTAESFLKGDAFRQLLAQGHYTQATEPTVREVSEKRASVADRTAVYKVYSGGSELLGTVIPRMQTFDGMDMNLQVLVGEDRHIMQEKIAGYGLESVTLPKGDPRGPGIFVYQEGERSVGFEPVNVLYKIASAKETRYVAMRMGTGEEIVLTVVPGLQKIANMGGRVIGIPESFKFVSLPGRQVRATEDLDMVQALDLRKTASAAEWLAYRDGEFIFEGRQSPCIRDRSYDSVDTEFILAGMGASRPVRQFLTKTARETGVVKFTGARPLRSSQERGLEAIKTAALQVKELSSLLPQCNTVKEVAVLAAPEAMELWKTAGIAVTKETLDAVLSLNFVTPENASIYLNYLPILEKTSSVLAELLVASRLGMDDVREAAAKNAMTQVNAVIRGLEQLSERVQ